MKGLLSRAPGGPETLKLADAPDPQAGSGQVVIAVKACAINYPDVLIIEDIVDSGMTLSFLKENLLSRGAASLHIATLLDKPERRRVPLHVDYSGFTIPDEFVVGYGLDYAEKYRNLPDIGVLRPEIYE